MTRNLKITKHVFSILINPLWHKSEVTCFNRHFLSLSLSHPYFYCFRILIQFYLDSPLPVLLLPPFCCHHYLHFGFLEIWVFLLKLAFYFTTCLPLCPTFVFCFFCLTLLEQHLKKQIAPPSPLWASVRNLVFSVFFLI